ncbi:MAG: GT4 family glycosyltransferase PelF [Candidatus Acidiferrum sp.]
MTTEGTYPFYTGGVSTWCQRLTHGLPDIDFTVLAVVTNPSPQCKYDLAPNVRKVIKVPQWGLLQPAEYSGHQPASVVLRNLWNTTPQVIATHFRPIFERFLVLLLSSNCDKEELGQVLLKLHSYFQWFDYQRTMNSADAWNVLQYALRAAWACRPPPTEQPTLAEVKQVYRLLYHLLTVLHFPIPHSDIAHSSAASFCGLPCVLAKLARGTPYVLTEHGVYLREQYLNLRRQVDSFFVRWFLYRVVENIVELNYHFADLVAPVCAYNSRWEKHLGVLPSRIKVIFNGVDPEKFSPDRQENGGRVRVSCLGLIYPLKGQLDLIGAAATLRPQFDNLEVRFYGAPADREYFDSCLGKVAEFKLQDCVTFAGSTKEPWKAYNEADVMAFPSISEAFPYAVLEAMSCGAAIVATDVGGVREALDDCGLVVPARTPHAMADAISYLLRNEAERKRLGQMARARVLKHFTEEQFLNSYASMYCNSLSRLPQQFLPEYGSRSECVC